MAVSGPPEYQVTHAKHILALEIMDLSMTFTADNEPVGITIGIHSGEVVTGVIGHRTSRYYLFGNTVNLTSRCDTTSVPRTINVGEHTHSYLMGADNYDDQFEVTYRGHVSMKGKAEPVQTWFLTRKKI